jgi:hypothetical protein
MSRFVVVVVVAVAACRTPAPTQQTERALFRDLERLVTVAETPGWGSDRVEVDKIMNPALDSVCRVGLLERRALATWIDAEISRKGGPVEAAYLRRGKRLKAVDDLLVLTRVKLVLARAEEMSLDCPFWLEPEHPFRGRQISEAAFVISLGGGGKGHIISQGTRQDLGFGGAARILFGRNFEHGNGLFVGAELNASGSFPRDEMGERTKLQVGADLVVPVVYRHVVSANTFLEFSGGWLGRSTEADWGDVDNGAHFGFALGGRALRTRFLFPGAALGLSWERTFIDGDDRTVIKFGIRGGFDIEL